MILNKTEKPGTDGLFCFKMLRKHTLNPVF